MRGPDFIAEGSRPHPPGARHAIRTPVLHLTQCLDDKAQRRGVLRALGSRHARVVLLTAFGVTDRQDPYDRAAQIHDLKRRSESLVRASGLPFTIVRPGWFDHNGPDQGRLTFVQDDTRQAGDPSDDVISRQHVAEVLVRGLGWPGASHRA